MATDLNSFEKMYRYMDNVKRRKVVLISHQQLVMISDPHCVLSEQQCDIITKMVNDYISNDSQDPLVKLCCEIKTAANIGPSVKAKEFADGIEIIVTY